MIITLAVFIVCGLIAAGLVALALRAFSPTRGGRTDIARGSISVLGVLLFGFLAFSAFGITQVDAGHVGVVREFGRVKDDELGPGLHWVVPVLNSIEVVDTRVQAIAFTDLDAASKEYQPIGLSGKLNVAVVPQEASLLIQVVGKDWAERIVKPAFANIVKEIIPQYGIGEVLPRRDEIRVKTIQRLKENIESRYGLTVNDVYFENVAFSQAYTDAIIAKQVAQQETERQRQLIEVAKAEAEQAQERAKGQANAAIERARGEAEANRLIGASLSDPVLQSRYIDKLTDKINVMLVPSGGNFLFDTKGLLDPQATPSPSPTPVP